MAKFLKIMVKQRFEKIFSNYHTFPCIQNIFKHHSLMASSLHVDPCVDAYSLQFHHLNSTVTCEAINIAFSTATSADSIDELGITVGLTDELGITDDNGPSGFSKTMPIFVGFFASTRLKYFNSAILKLPKNISKLYFQKWLVIFEIFVNKLIRKLLRIGYRSALASIGSAHY